MARTRAHRRRQSLRIVVALVLTFLVLAFGREVSRSAHQLKSARLSENLTFQSLATTVLVQENAFDARLSSLLSTGSGLTRPAFAVQLSSLEQDLSLWRDEVGLMATPVLSPDLNVTLVRDTQTRVDDYDTVLSYVAKALDLSGPSAPATLSLGAAQLSLSATAASWGQDRHLLANAPGNVTLVALNTASAQLNVPQDVATLLASPSLTPTRAIVIAAIQVQPAPFPAPPLSLLLAPTTTMQVQVAVSNLREILQPVSLSMVLQPVDGATQKVTLTQTLAPNASYAFVAHTFAVVPGERATLSVSVNGVPPQSSLAHSRTYALSVSPSGAG